MLGPSRVATRGHHRYRRVVASPHSAIAGHQPACLLLLLSPLFPPLLMTAARCLLLLALLALGAHRANGARTLLESDGIHTVSDQYGQESAAWSCFRRCPPPGSCAAAAATRNLRQASLPTPMFPCRLPLSVRGGRRRNGIKQHGEATHVLPGGQAAATSGRSHKPYRVHVCLPGLPLLPGVGLVPSQYH